MIYCVDTSAFMDAWVRWYPQEIFPSLWSNVDNLIAEERLISSEEVLQEIERKEGDSLYDWAKKREAVFLPLDDQVQGYVNSVMATHPRLVDGRTGKSYADPFVIATAIVKQSTIVTGERATGSRDRPKIPDVCRDLKLRCIGFTELIRQEGWRF